MGAPDFESRRISRLHQGDPLGDPIEFTLFGRVWRCVPIIPFTVMQETSANLNAPEASALDIYVAILEMIYASVVNRDAWDRELSISYLDEETISEVGTWLAEQYADRWTRRLAEPEEPSNVYTLADKIADAKAVAERVETPQEADRRHRATHLAKMMVAGGEIKPPEDPEGIATFEMARMIASSGDPELWDD